MLKYTLYYSFFSTTHSSETTMIYVLSAAIYDMDIGNPLFSEFIILTNESEESLLVTFIEMQRDIITRKIEIYEDINTEKDQLIYTIHFELDTLTQCEGKAFILFFSELIDQPILPCRNWAFFLTQLCGNYVFGLKN